MYEWETINYSVYILIENDTILTTFLKLKAVKNTLSNDYFRSSIDTNLNISWFRGILSVSFLFFYNTT